MLSAPAGIVAKTYIAKLYFAGGGVVFLAVVDL
jgi:hypothetical protein